MSSQRFTLEAAQSVEIRKVGGDLVVRGWDKAEMDARGDGVQLEQFENLVAVSSKGDMVVEMPRGASVSIGAVGGDAKIEDLDGAVILSAIGGDVLLRNVAGPVAMNGPVGGDTRFDNVSQVSVAGGQYSRSQRAAEEAQRRSEKQQRRAEERMRQVEKKMDRARAKTGVDFGSWMWRRRGGMPLKAEADERVSEEERMAILKMLQEKKITAAQADTLLAALEGDQNGPQAGGPPAEGTGG